MLSATEKQTTFQKYVPGTMHLSLSLSLYIYIYIRRPVSASSVWDNPQHLPPYHLAAILSYCQTAVPTHCYATIPPYMPTSLLSSRQSIPHPVSTGAALEPAALQYEGHRTFTEWSHCKKSQGRCAICPIYRVVPLSKVPEVCPWQHGTTE